jgi:hypothetical protein
MVVNAMLVAMVAHANQPGDVVYHVGSSVRNPVTYLNLQDYGFNYFTENIIGNELIGPNGKGLDPLSIWSVVRFMTHMYEKNHNNDGGKFAPTQTKF